MRPGRSFDRVRMFAERERAGLTLSEVGKKAGLKKFPRQHAWRYESGVVRHPRPRVLRDLANALGVDHTGLVITDAALAEREAVLSEWLRGDQEVPFYEVMDERFGSIAK